MDKIINLRDSIEELEKLPIERWEEFQKLRMYILELELKRVTEALKFLESASPSQVRRKALDYKKSIEEKMKNAEEKKRWPPKRSGRFTNVDEEIIERQ